MTQKAFPISAEFMATANTTPDKYLKEYQQSVESTEANDAFLGETCWAHWLDKKTN